MTTTTDSTPRWHVPGDYDIGPGFDTIHEAVAYARSQQVPMWNGQPCRMFVDLRQTRALPTNRYHYTGSEDSVIVRFEVYPDRIEPVR